MTSLDDLLNVRFNLTALITMDMQRIEDDPAWQRIRLDFDMTDAKQRERALDRYLSTYLVKEDILRFCPSTNGPADVLTTNVELTYSFPNA